MKVNIRADSVEISGYVNSIERNSKVLSSRIGKFIERICKGAFSNALKRNNDVHVLLNHDWNRDLGSTKQGNLELHEDNIGLHARAVITDPDVIEDARKGNLVGWSFGFEDVPDGVESGMEGGYPLRKVRDLNLHEVSILNRSRVPAYDGTLIMARAEEEPTFYGEAFFDEVEVIRSEDEKPIDYSFYENIIEELRFNPNHDGKTGRFSSKGGGGGWYGNSKNDQMVAGIMAMSDSELRNMLSDKEQFVRDNTGLTAKPISKEPLNMDKIKSRGGVSDEVAQQSAKLADDIYEKASKSEPQITSDIIGAVGNVGGEMYGLDFRLKQPTSMAGKIASDAKDDKISLEKSASNIKDAIRYTAILDEDNFTSGYESIKKQLEGKNYVETRCKNFYNMYGKGKSDQKAVQCVYQDKKTGQMFELQFHTINSAGAKEINHPLYEKQREKVTSKGQKKALGNKMRKKIAPMVRDPKGVSTIKDHKD